MRRLAVIHHRHQDWVPALREAEPRLDIQGWHPSQAPDAAWLREAEGLFTWRIPEGLLAGMPRLAWVQNSGAGVDHLVGHPGIPPEVPITRADGQFGLWMARYVVGHLLAGPLRMEACREAQARAQWSPKLLPEDLTGRVALVVGFGRIGRQIGRALRELGLAVHGFVQTPRPDPEFALHGVGDLAGLMPEARLLVLCAPLTPATRGLVDARLLAQAGPDLLLINVGRGEQVVIPDLLAALDAGRPAGAVLDVFPTEPLPADAPLWAHPRVTVTPHHSGPSTPRAMIPDLLDNLRRFAEGRPIVGAVDRARGY
ncbi:D-2-hydroxyacid dehydrogenase [Mesoterricola sediminis]|uniref:Glyoxylate/hydroxypyruvate reductase A n=1 Tax=Mesoterricola sediminis TaxID=2927980 RepID=A0AA48H115_9BACT|nr:D-2-hydroxyacid dehydrogenase [Mesoterricola sediminis]BDU77657.1 glyoxylate/hydroxypyruvate reductase A [Mesoterricola sediminis]